jgi:hypothetical protein
LDPASFPQAVATLTKSLGESQIYSAKLRVRPQHLL